MDDWNLDNTDLGSIAPLKPVAAEWFGEHARNPLEGSGGWIDETLVRAPERFGSELAPLLKAARTAVLAAQPAALDGVGGDLERAVKLAQQRLHRRVPLRTDLPAPLLTWSHEGLVVCVPSRVPGAGDSAAACVWISHSDEIAFARAKRVQGSPDRIPTEAAAWIAHAEDEGIPASAWSVALPSFCETIYPIAVEIAPNPTGFMHAMYIAHAGAAVLAAGFAGGVGGTLRIPGSPPAEARLVPSGWSYIKPDRSPGMCAPYFPNGARLPSNAVFVPDEALFLACARATWPASIRDALRVAFCR